VNDLRSLPSVDHLLKTEPVLEWITRFGRPLTLDALRLALNDARLAYAKGRPLPGEAALLDHANRYLEHWTAPTLQPVINAAGVILHTNLGRAPLSAEAMQAAQRVALGYSTLEYDLHKGKRGTRLVHAEALLCRLTGAEAAVVVNNNAAAVMLALSALARRRAVVIARSQLVEIGGGFRVPDVMKQSGARLLEVGTTNRVHVSDYRDALEGKPALFLHAHRSNFRIVGFTDEPQLDEIAGVAHAAGIPLVDDLGSGALLDTARFGLGHEPTVQESMAAGADLVCFSGDKLLGGPQAGIVIGRSTLVEKLKKHPLARAFRADKLCLAALMATLLHYLKDEAQLKIPIWRMIGAPLDQLQARVEAWRQALGMGEIIPGESTVGGGSLPGETLPTCLLALEAPSPDRLAGRLRQAHPPVIARVQAERLVLDPRSVLPEQDMLLIEAVRAALRRS
jgi:L-seryl-tRNA(Ser) seleniumtransferase